MLTEQQQEKANELKTYCVEKVVFNLKIQKSITNIITPTYNYKHCHNMIPWSALATALS